MAKHKSYVSLIEEVVLSIKKEIEEKGTRGPAIKVVDGRCEDCGCSDAELGPCPYDSDLHGNKNELWLCADCASNRADEL